MADLASLQSQLLAHIEKVNEEPSTPLDVRLLEQCEIFLPDNISQETSADVIGRLANILPNLQQDPTPATKLLLRLLEPYPLSVILSFDPPVDFVGGLSTPIVAFNLLMIALLAKATHDASEAAILAGLPSVVYALVKLWLCTPDAGVAQNAGGLLIGLLKIDQEGVNILNHGSGDGIPRGSGQGLIWRRLFGDCDVYGLLYDACSHDAQTSKLELSKAARTLAQARLMDLLPDVARMDWRAATESHHPDIESRFGLHEGQGLLDFATVHMVNYKDDPLMHMNLINFYSALLVKTRQASPCLEYLITQGVHARTAAFVLDPNNPSHDPIDKKFLYGPSAAYLSTYASRYPDHFLASSSAGTLLLRLTQSFDPPPSAWMTSRVNKHDLSLVASLPRVALLPQRPGRNHWRSSPLSQIPSGKTNPDALLTLAKVFHGPGRVEDSASNDMMIDHSTTERAAARALYLLYVDDNQQFFSDLVKHAETVAVKENALAALTLMSAIITADWGPLPSSPTTVGSFTLPTNDMLRSNLPDGTLPSPPTGVLAILTPSAMKHILAYLFRPAQTFSNLVRGHGDSESAAYKIAVAKHDCLTLLYGRLKPLAAGDEGIRMILQAVEKRVRDGPWSNAGEVGGRVGTLDL